jgi:hypothetical protein
MKKLAILVLISALLTFTAAMALANDDNNGFKHFSGTYAMSASGSCIHSQNEYGPETVGWPGYSYINAGGIVYAGPTVSKGTYVFKKDGTGTYSYTMYATVTPPVQAPPLPCTIPGGIRIFSADDLTFTYEITPFGNITVKAMDENGEEDTLSGSISADKKTMTLFDALRGKGPVSNACPWYNIMCTATRTLIKVHD